MQYLESHLCVTLDVELLVSALVQVDGGNGVEGELDHHVREARDELCARARLYKTGGLTFTRYCHHQCCWVPGIKRGGGGRGRILLNGRAIVLQWGRLRKRGGGIHG